MSQLCRNVQDTARSVAVWTSVARPALHLRKSSSPTRRCNQLEASAAADVPVSPPSATAHVDESPGEKEIADRPTLNAADESQALPCRRRETTTSATSKKRTMHKFAQTSQRIKSNPSSRLNVSASGSSTLSWRGLKTFINRVSEVADWKQPVFETF